MTDTAVTPAPSTEGVDPSQWRDGVVDISTAPAIDTGGHPSVSPSLPAVNRHGLAAVRLALTQFGVRESPRGSNENPYSAYFGRGAQYWCADFVSWAFDQTGNRDRAVPWGPPSAVRNINAWAQARRLFRPSPEAGNIFTYRNDAHTGLVVAVFARYFLTIEGNTGGPGDIHHETWVASHVRDHTDGRYRFVRFPD